MNESSPEAIPAVQANDRFAARLRGFGPLGILAILIILGGNFVIMPLSAILALIWAKISNTRGASLVTCGHAVGRGPLSSASGSELRSSSR
jgi:hypothetical protein